MKWEIGQCKAGDMIRVKIGPIEHFGIFASEDEVLQFGHPLRDITVKNPREDIRICACTIAEFAVGNMVEVARLSLAERLRRFSRTQTVRRARSRVGENGYDILRNNCEHFATWCVFGQESCSQTDRIAEEWRERPLLDVYLCPVGEEDAYTGGNELRAQMLRQVTDPALRRQKSATWKLLEYAILRSFGKKTAQLRFTLEKNGKWNCDALHFSLSHTEHWAAVAVSNAAVGVDVEELSAFLRRDPAQIAQLFCTKEELAQNPAAEELLCLWMLKESAYKCDGKGNFAPKRTQLHTAHRFCRIAERDLALAVTGRNVAQLRVYLCKDFCGAKRVVISEDGT